MRPMTTKLVFLICYVAFVFALTWFPEQDTREASMMTGFILMVGLGSLNRNAAIVGDGESPGFLFILTFLWLVGPICFLELLPNQLYTFGISMRPHPITAEAVLLDCGVGLFITILVWIPYIGYSILDYAFGRLRVSELPE